MCIRDSLLIVGVGILVTNVTSRTNDVTDADALLLGIVTSLALMLFVFRYRFVQFLTKRGASPWQVRLAMWTSVVLLMSYMMPFGVAILR